MHLEIFVYTHIYPVIDISRQRRDEKKIKSELNQQAQNGYLTTPKVGTWPRGLVELSSNWYWPYPKRLPPNHPSNWLPISPLTSRNHLVFDEINFDQSRTSDFIFKKNCQDFIGAKHTPGCAFLFFLQEKTLQRVMIGSDGRNVKAFALRCGHAKITRCS